MVYRPKHCLVCGKPIEQKGLKPRLYCPGTSGKPGVPSYCAVKARKMNIAQPQPFFSELVNHLMERLDEALRECAEVKASE